MFSAGNPALKMRKNVRLEGMDVENAIQDDVTESHFHWSILRVEGCSLEKGQRISCWSCKDFCAQAVINLASY